MRWDVTLLARYEEPEAVHAFFDVWSDYNIKCLDIVFKKVRGPLDYSYGATTGGRAGRLLL
jgi:hypothetical protein